MVNVIVAVGRRRQIGLNGKLPWHDKEDLRWFRHLTTGGFLIAGWKTYEGIDLKDRIMFRDGPLPAEETITLIRKHFGALPIWVIGGRSVYVKYAPVADQLYISRINYGGPADAFFPEEAYPQSLIDRAIVR